MICIFDGWNRRSNLFYWQSDRERNLTFSSRWWWSGGLTNNIEKYHSLLFLTLLWRKNMWNHIHQASVTQLGRPAKEIRSRSANVESTPIPIPFLGTEWQWLSDGRLSSTNLHFNNSLLRQKKEVARDWEVGKKKIVNVKTNMTFFTQILSFSSGNTLCGFWKRSFKRISTCSSNFQDNFTVYNTRLQQKVWAIIWRYGGLEIQQS